MPELADWYQGGLSSPAVGGEPLVAWSTRAEPMAPSPPQSTRSAALPEPVLGAICRAVDLSRLPAGWNSYGAKAISMEAVHRAVRFLVEAATALPNLAAPAVVPTVSGGIQLEWHRLGVDVEIEFHTHQPPSWCAEDRETGNSTEDSIVNQWDDVLRWLSRVSG